MLGSKGFYCWDSEFALQELRAKVCLMLNIVLCTRVEELRFFQDRALIVRLRKIS